MFPQSGRFSLSQNSLHSFGFSLLNEGFPHNYPRLLLGYQNRGAVGNTERWLDWNQLDWTAFSGNRVFVVGLLWG